MSWLNDRNFGWENEKRCLHELCHLVLWFKEVKEREGRIVDENRKEMAEEKKNKSGISKNIFKGQKGYCITLRAQERRCSWEKQGGSQLLSLQLQSYQEGCRQIAGKIPGTLTHVCRQLRKAVFPFPETHQCTEILMRGVIAPLLFCQPPSWLWCLVNHFYSHRAGNCDSSMLSSGPWL